MKVKYLGPRIRATFTNNTIYEVVEIDKITGALRIIDDSMDDYLYSPTEPRLLGVEYQGGRFEIVEDDAKNSLFEAIYGNSAKNNNMQAKFNIVV
ncbi:MAG: hypothetical protein FWD23_01270 [Oscillospiraceae bacterium]|nr:hypothetical protein [Oscillospiraceae bacterium]